jgi:hypothetical protein
MLMALAAIAANLGAVPNLPEYRAEEARKHIGESATDFAGAARLLLSHC